MPIKDVIRSVTPNFIWEKLRQQKISRSVNQYQRRVVERNYCGHQLKVLIADGLGEGWYDKDWEPLEELELLASGKLRPGATVFDLGAHQGVVAMLMAKAVGPTGRVIAIEGMKHNCDVANENLRLNGIANVTVHHAVIANKDGQIRFFDGLNGSVASEGVGQMVEAITIDSLAKKYGEPDVVFIDIEGFELKALEGATQCLFSDADWFVEVHVGCGLEKYGGSVQGIFKYLGGQRYERFIWNLNTNQKPQPLTANSLVFDNRFAIVALCRHTPNNMLDASQNW
jgi:FkbM family methyltransferase